MAVPPRRPPKLILPEFSGGLNLRDAPDELRANESPNLWNTTLDERGSVSQRLRLPTPVTPHGPPPPRLYWCAAGDATKWAAVDGGGSNDLRDKDDAAIVCVHGLGGFDQQTR